MSTAPSPLASAPAPGGGVPAPVAGTTLVERIDAALPQTQCRRCGYDGCRPYAEAVAAGAPLNRCPPGGATVITVLAALTRRAVAPLDTACGAPGPLAVARIDEAACIGCTLCIQACPVDAIIGAPKRLHAVLSALCTGCELCVPPCPVDCITMVAAGRSWSPADALAARRRFDARSRRIAGRRHAADSVAAEPTAALAATGADAGRLQRQAAVAAALARARARRAGDAAPVPRIAAPGTASEAPR